MLINPYVFGVAGGGGVWPPATGMGEESDWILTGSITWDAGTHGLHFDGAVGTATLTGTAVAQFDAVVPSLTERVATITVASFADFGQISALIKGGEFLWEAEDNGDILAQNTTGAASGLSFAFEAGTPDWIVTAIVFSAP